MQQSEVDVFLPVHIICPSEAAIDKLTNVNGERGYVMFSLPVVKFRLT